VNRRARQNKSSGNRVNPNDSMMVSSTRGSAIAQVDFPKEDFFRRNRSWQLTQSPPKSVSNQIHWVKTTFNSAQIISTVAPTEVNFSFALSDFVDTAGLAGFFDQFCIYSAIVNVSFNYSGTTPGGLGQVVTAIDYDNVGNLGLLSAVQAFESALTTKIVPDQSIQRLIHPTVSPALYNGTLFTDFGLSRMWIDSASPATPHYGFRSFYISNVGTVLTAQYDRTCVIGFRNNI